MKTVALMPSSWAARATPWAWLPALAATTPRARCSSRELGDAQVGAADLERAGALQVLALDPDVAGRSARRASAIPPSASPARCRARTSRAARMSSSVDRSGTASSVPMAAHPRVGPSACEAHGSHPERPGAVRSPGQRHAEADTCMLHASRNMLACMQLIRPGVHAQPSQPRPAVARGGRHRAAHAGRPPAAHPAPRGPGRPVDASPSPSTCCTTDGMRLSDLAAAVELDASTVSRQIKQLRGQGHRRAHPRPRRRPRQPGPAHRRTAAGHPACRLPAPVRTHPDRPRALERRRPRAAADPARPASPPTSRARQRRRQPNIHRTPPLKKAPDDPDPDPRRAGLPHATGRSWW